MKVYIVVFFVIDLTIHTLCICFLTIQISEVLLQGGLLHFVSFKVFKGPVQSIHPIPLMHTQQQEADRSYTSG